MAAWLFCFMCGFKKPQDRIKRVMIDGKRRNLCFGCYEDFKVKVKPKEAEKNA